MLIKRYLSYIPEVCVIVFTQDLFYYRCITQSLGAGISFGILPLFTLKYMLKFMHMLKSYVFANTDALNVIVAPNCTYFEFGH